MDTVWHLRIRSGIHRNGLASADSGRVGMPIFVAITGYGCPCLLGVVTCVIDYTCNNSRRFKTSSASRRRPSFLIAMITMMIPSLVLVPMLPAAHGAAWCWWKQQPRHERLFFSAPPSRWSFPGKQDSFHIQGWTEEEV